MKTLKEIRENKGVPTSLMAKIIDINITEYEKLERDPMKLNKLDYPVFSRMANILEIDVDELQEAMRNEQTDKLGHKMIRILDDLNASSELIKSVPDATKRLREDSPIDGFDTSMNLIETLLEGNSQSIDELYDIVNELFELSE